MAYRNTIAIVAVSVAVGYWLTLPPDRVAFDEDCSPADFQARLSALIHGADFWLAQDAAAQAMALQLAALPAATTRSNDELKSTMGPLEQKMMHLSLKDGAKDQLSIAAEQRARLEKMGWLQRCRDLMAARER